MTPIWNIRLYQLASGNYKVRIEYDGGSRIVTGTGPTVHRAYKTAENQLVVKPWLTSKEG